MGVDLSTWKVVGLIVGYGMVFVALMLVAVWPIAKDLDDRKVALKERQQKRKT